MSSDNSIFYSLDLIEKRISERLTVENLAGCVYFSKDHYQRLFREIVGETVMEYVTKRKLTLAGRALLETNATIIDIAVEYGYDSREGFSRSFKAYMGISPTEYRKHGLAAISQKIIKERVNMLYTKSTDEIIRELNDFIVKIKGLAKETRKIKDEDRLFWNKIAEHTDVLADRVQSELDRIGRIAEYPDEITNGFAVLKLLDDLVFEMNLVALQTAITAAQTPEYAKKFQPLADEYRNLALSGVNKTVKLKDLMRSLASSIVADMRKTAGELINEAVAKGDYLIDCMQDDANYIKDEIVRIVDELSSTPVEDMTALMLSDSIFKMGIISFTAKFAMLPNSDKILTAMDSFTEKLETAVNFCQSIVKAEPDQIPERKTITLLMDIAFQDNILLFYTRGVIEKLESAGNISEEQRKAFHDIDNKISACIQVALNAERNSSDYQVFKEVAEMLFDIVVDLDRLAESLGEYGGGIRLLAVEHKNLAKRTLHCLEEVFPQD